LRTFFECYEASIRTMVDDPACYAALAEGLDAAAKARQGP
jgi:hypothetical protein